MKHLKPVLAVLITALLSSAVTAILMAQYLPDACLEDAAANPLIPLNMGSYPMLGHRERTLVRDCIIEAVTDPKSAKGFNRKK